MEGPSLFLAQEQLKPFTKKKIISLEGNTKIGKERLLNQEVKEIFSWGKHLVFQFEDFALRTHFMLFGTFQATIDGKKVTGDYEKKGPKRLSLTFENGQINMFNCSLKYIESKAAKSDYDFSVDIMNLSWDPKKAFTTTTSFPEEEIADVLLDQDIFAGVGNIIKNEVLWLCKIHPKTKIKDIDNKKLKEIIKETQEFSLQFYKWRKDFILKKNLKIYRKSTCPNCQNKITREKTGKRMRVSFYCETCQK